MAFVISHLQQIERNLDDRSAPPPASLSSLASSLFQEKFDAAIHTYELAVIFRAPSSTP
jgi:hypothetical protein